MGKHNLLYDNWIYNVASRNAFVWKALAKSNRTGPKDKILCGKRRELPGRFSKKNKTKTKTFPGPRCSPCLTLPICRDTGNAGGVYVLLYLFLRNWFTPLWFLGSPESLASRLGTHRGANVAFPIHSSLAEFLSSGGGQSFSTKAFDWLDEAHHIRG